jgi:hypothetical protein
MFQRVTVVQNGLTLPRGATLIPQAGVKPLFTISGGIIEILGISGMVTTLIAGGANVTKFQFKPTGQTAIDLCATTDINGLTVGQLLGTAGPLASALLTGYGIVGASTTFRAGPGTIDLNCAAAAGTGAVRVTLRYQSIDPGGVVALA